MRYHNKQKPNPLIIFSEEEKKRIKLQLQKQFGIKEILGTLIKRGKERIFLFQGEFKGKEIKHLESFLPIERVGVYFAKESDNGEVRLSIEGVHLLKDQITTGIFELNEEQAQSWMEGNELEIKTGLRGFLIMKYKEYYLGCGKASENKISNFVPKSRRLKAKTII